MEQLEQALQEMAAGAIEVDLDNAGIGDLGATRLAEALKSSRCLRRLLLDGNNIGAEGAKMLAEALEHNRSLEMLGLNDNNIGFEGAQWIAKALQHNNCLQTLYLHRNSLGPEGGRVLAEALKSNSGLQTVWFQKNGFCDEGAKHLAEALTVNTGLLCLVLTDNGLSAEGVAFLAEALKNNTSLQTLDLNGNDDIGEEGARSLVEALELNWTLLNLPYEGVDEDLDYQVITLLARNQDPIRAEKEVEGRKPKVFLTLHMEGGHQVVCRYTLSGEQVATLDGTAVDEMTIRDWTQSVARSLKLSWYRLHCERTDSSLIDVNSELSIRQVLEGLLTESERQGCKRKAGEQLQSSARALDNDLVS